MPDNDPNYRGLYAAYQRLLALAVIDEIGPCRRVARELTFDAREGIIGMALYDHEMNPHDDAVEWVLEICKEENRANT